MHNELYHFGIKGMRWGHWNEETRRKREGPTFTRYTGNPNADTSRGLYVSAGNPNVYKEVAYTLPSVLNGSGDIYEETYKPKKPF